MRHWLAAIVLLCAFASGVGANDKVAPGLGDYTPPGWPNRPSETALVGRLAVMTLLTIGLGVAVVVWARRANRLPKPAVGKEVQMELLASAPLGAGCTLHLLQVEDACFVIGADRSGLKAIQPVGDPFAEALGEKLRTQA